MKSAAILVFSIAISLSFNCGRRSKYKHTTQLQKGFFVEIFSAGIIGNLKADYLTDSINFRIYIGTFDDESERLYYKIVGDSIFVQKIVPKKGFVPGTQTEIEFERHYSLGDLKAQRRFD